MSPNDSSPNTGDEADLVHMFKYSVGIISCPGMMAVDVNRPSGARHVSSCIYRMLSKNGQSDGADVASCETAPVEADRL
jgi:hypothetical protein